MSESVYTHYRRGHYTDIHPKRTTLRGKLLLSGSTLFCILPLLWVASPFDEPIVWQQQYMTRSFILGFFNLLTFSAVGLILLIPMIGSMRAKKINARFTQYCVLWLSALCFVGFTPGTGVLTDWLGYHMGLAGHILI